jgi:hypothetical protein
MAGVKTFPAVSEMVSVPAGRAAVPVTIRKSPAVLFEGKLAEIVVIVFSLPFTFFCTSAIPEACVAVKAGTVASLPLTLTFWEVGMKLAPDLVGVTVYVPFATLLKP